MIYKCLAVMA